MNKRTSFRPVPIEWTWGWILLALFLGRQALFGESALRLKDTVVAAPGTTLGALFENRGGVAGPAFRTPLDLAPGYHYLDADGVRHLLSQISPSLSNLTLQGEGVRVYMQGGAALANPLAGRKSPRLPLEAGSGEAASPSPDAGEMFLFSRNWEGRSVIPKGTAVLIGREGGSVLLQLTGTLARDFDWTSGMKIRLSRGGVTLERTVSRDQVVFY